jgi:hypothetical protein
MEAFQNQANVNLLSKSLASAGRKTVTPSPKPMSVLKCPQVAAIEASGDTQVFRSLLDISLSFVDHDSLGLSSHRNL